jgi:Cu+-exporting ATPase
MALSSLSVVTNASRLRRWHPPLLPDARTPETVQPVVETATSTEPEVRTATATDPVCGMQTNPATAPEHRYTSDGTVHFCSAHCAAAYDADPDRCSGSPAGRGHTQQQHEGR